MTQQAPIEDRAVIRVIYSRSLRQWLVCHGILKLPCPTRLHARAAAVDLAEWHVEGGGIAEVVVHRMDGTISKAGGTYPRSSDPRRSKG